MTLPTFGSYQLLRKLGEGGMGTVYVALHRGIQRQVAIKLLKADCAEQPDLLERFFDEARAAARIMHPGIVQTLDCGLLPTGGAFLVMELLQGECLATRLQRGTLNVSTATHIAWQIASALSAAHQLGIVHRDLKPDNIMLVPDPLSAIGERVKVLDFGIAKLAHSARVRTRSSIIMGTPKYMSPEQCRGASDVDGRADVYSLGIVLFEMLAGRAPFVAESIHGYLYKHISEPAPDLAQVMVAVPADLAALVNRMLEKHASGRPTMGVVHETLRVYLGLPPQPRLEQETLRANPEGFVPPRPTRSASSSADPSAVAGQPAPASGWPHREFGGTLPLPSLASSSMLGQSTGRRRKRVRPLILFCGMALCACGVWAVARWAVVPEDGRPPLAAAQVLAVVPTPDAAVASGDLQASSSSSAPNAQGEPAKPSQQDVSGEAASPQAVTRKAARVRSEDAADASAVQRTRKATRRDRASDPKSSVHSRAPTSLEELIAQ